MRSPSRGARALGAAAFAAILLISGCGGGGSSKKTDAPSTSATPTPPPSTTEAPPPPPPPPPTNPLTGVVGAAPAAVVGVKIDDTASARPHIGTDVADVVYIEQAEGGLTRLLAVYGSQLPTVGPVRSLRRSDAELLSQYGHVPLAASGGAGGPVAAVDASVLINAQYGNIPGAYARLGSRPAPYNLVADLSAVVASTAATPAQDVGFRWAADDPRLAAAPGGTTVHTVVGQTSVDFAYDAATGRYVRSIDGAAQTVVGGAPESTPNVLVQICDVQPDPEDVDVNGQLSQYTSTIGSGPAVLFRGGKRIDGTWSRPAIDAPTTFTAADAAPMLLAPGGVWVALAQQGSPVDSS